jgi:two-component system nitrogen regulation response regulator NtrX
LQEQKFERVGGSETIQVDVRIIAATNKDLKSEIKRGTFREDLFHRLNVIPFTAPALRDRGSDIPLLAEHFLRDLSHVHGKGYRDLTKGAIEVLSQYSWPGNVRELRNLLERVIILTGDNQIGSPIQAAEILDHLHDETLTSQFQATASDDAQESKRLKSLRDARAAFDREFILKTLKENDFNVSKTAHVLGVERSHLHKKIKTLGIEAPEPESDPS